MWGGDVGVGWGGRRGALRSGVGGVVWMRVSVAHIGSHGVSSGQLLSVGVAEDGEGGTPLLLLDATLVAAAVRPSWRKMKVAPIPMRIRLAALHSSVIREKRSSCWAALGCPGVKMRRRSRQMEAT